MSAAGWVALLAVVQWCAGFIWSWATRDYYVRAQTGQADPIPLEAANYGIGMGRGIRLAAWGTLGCAAFLWLF